jgi:hypothetical protein
MHPYIIFKIYIYIGLTTIVTLREETLENVREYSKKVELMKISMTSNWQKRDIKK